MCFPINNSVRWVVNFYWVCKQFKCNKEDCWLYLHQIDAVDKNVILQDFLKRSPTLCFMHVPFGNMCAVKRKYYHRHILDCNLITKVHLYVYKQRVQVLQSRAPLVLGRSWLLRMSVENIQLKRQRFCSPSAISGHLLYSIENRVHYLNLIGFLIIL